ncbi:MAG TPA: cytochrome c biogenesis protein ResB [Pseudogracilibacillus sp.]|nr:cytochrome c biogenesis protein ResB [Pseudogracilibacillus sp.]
MDKIKCECGHINPEGTVLCEACGKPVEGNQHIEGNDNQKLLNMRYDGSARRSQTYNRRIVDKVWTFFSSVKVGIWLIVIALLASGIGTIFPQAMYIPADAPNRDPAVFYEDYYGIAGKIYYQLGFHEMYSSWWYLIVIALIGISLVICSLDRFIPLRRALKMQKPKRHNTFLTRQRLYSKSENISEEEKQKVVESLKNQRYKIVEEDGHVLAEKGRFSRWGPYVNHIGLIIILLAALLRMTPLLYLDDYVWVREGEEIIIPGTDNEYYIENKKFTLEVYDKDDPRFKDALEKAGEVHKGYTTEVKISKVKEDAVVGAADELEVVKTDKLMMNHPVKFDGYTLYQSGYQENEFKTMYFDVVKANDENQEVIDSIEVDLRNPEETYELADGLRVQMEQFYPDYALEDGQPITKTKYPRNPAFVFSVFPPESDEGELSFLGIGQNIDPTGENEYQLVMNKMPETLYVSGITVRRDYTIPLFIIGAAIFMIGVTQGMYWQHRRIWLNPNKGNLLMAAHTNKNWFGIKKDLEKAIEGTSITMVEDQQEIDK